MTTIIHDKNLPDWNGEAWHVQIDDKHYVISSIDCELIPGYHVAETMAFVVGDEGQVENFREVAVRRCPGAHETLIAELEEA